MCLCVFLNSVFPSGFKESVCKLSVLIFLFFFLSLVVVVVEKKNRKEIFSLRYLVALVFFIDATHRERDNDNDNIEREKKKNDNFEKLITCRIRLNY